ncbi:tannase/feruloyl esterase family alpha/beta hydrolase [Couchioplanes caeruleus]|uniref:tannase/feruloyl esterase family alpha/beta hydrolase n=1 Tax=Couchioplanes caeruleus TaxID=56438 RepID=UPI0020C0CB7E|nr:tannase/feruloyl esterase family alpha/beta hydrolase [Couchioplanes caeruleus]UQU62800.1 tannase/feruloyl esterase family alpha/beta hydrolase [Couchioplanes caeruleus]
MSRLTRRIAALATSVITLGAAVGVGSGAGAAPQPAVAPGRIAPVVSCPALATLDLARVRTSVGGAAEVTREGHRYCSVTGYISPQTRFEVLLPVSTWAGDYLQQGCGGFCGAVGLSLTDPSRTSGYQAPFPALGNGELVVAADDQGHEAAVNTDTLWARDDPQLRVVFGYSSEHSMAITARALIRAYYGRDAARRYFDGVSDGGHEALDLAQRFPGDFDGIVAGAPANNWSALAGLFEPWLARVNLDRHDRQILTAEKLPALHAAVMRACAGADGVITDPRACTFQPSALRCPAGTDTPACLTAPQIAVVRAFYRGPVDRRGRNLFDGGMPYGSELAWQVWAVQPAADAAAPGDTVAAALGLNYLRNAAFWHNPPVTMGLRDVRFTVAEHRRLQEVGDIYDATNPDLRRFAARGGKLIIYHGWADQAIPPFESLDYYREVSRWSGGFTRAQSFSRLYMIPGLYHCPCGQPVDGDPATVVDMMTPLVRWVRDGIAPGTLTLPVTAGSTGRPPAHLSVRPFDPAGRAPHNNGLNSDYHYVGYATTYRPGAALWCRQDGPALRCT